MAVALLALSQTKHENWFLTAATGVAVFFTSAMVAHRTLYEARPAARYLTEFYLWMSFGGALGGLSAALHRAQDLQRGVRVSAAAGAVDGMPAGRVRACSDAARRRASIAYLAQARVGTVPEAMAPGEMTDPDKQKLLVLWLIAAGGILAIYWLPWAVTKLAP